MPHVGAVWTKCANSHLINSNYHPSFRIKIQPHRNDRLHLSIVRIMIAGICILFNIIALLFTLPIMILDYSIQSPTGRVRKRDFLAFRTPL